MLLLGPVSPSAAWGSVICGCESAVASAVLSRRCTSAGLSGPAPEEYIHVESTGCVQDEQIIPTGRCVFCQPCSR